MSSPLFSDYEINVQALMRGLVHELRNPLSAVLTASSLVQSGPDADEETAMLLDVIEKESRRMNRILTEFSHFVKPPRPNTQSFDLGEVACATVSHLKSEGAFAGVEIEGQLSDALPVTGDPVQTEQALRHVLENAAQALQGGGQLRLSSDQSGALGCVIIEDSGGPLAPEVIEHAFQPFFSTKPASTGLGLSIARMALRAAGGDVTLEAGADGARVQLCLPLDTQHAATPQLIAANSR